MAGGFKRTFRFDRSSEADARRAVEDELRHHLELAAQELVEAGWVEEEARREARARFGDVEETRARLERVHMERERRERRRAMMSMDELRQDVKYAVRSIRKTPGYAGLVVLTLAFGIAANTTIFSLMNPYLFRPLPFESPQELVQVNQVDPVTGWDMARFSYPQYADWKERSRSFDDLGAYAYGSTNVTESGAAEQIQSSVVTTNMFEVLGARPAIGRTLRAEDGAPGAEPVVILDHGLWQRRWAGDPQIVGGSISLDGRPHTVVGIMEPDFVFPFGGVKLWTPIQEASTGDRGRVQNYQLIGRLAAGRTREEARAELTGIQAELSSVYPDTDGRMDGVTVKPVREALNFAWEVIHVLFYVLLGAVAFVLLIACTNVASLSLARASNRLREVSVRAALGATRGRIVRQLFTESTLLALLGGALGVAVAHFVTAVLNPVVPEDLYRVGDIDIDGRVLAFSLAITSATPVAFGLLPAIQSSRADLVSGLKEGSTSSGSITSSRMRRVLVVAQVALAVVLITGAGLMLRSFTSVRSLDLGFEAEELATVEVLLPTEAYPSAEERHLFMEEAVTVVAGIPEVVSASAVQWLPLNHETISRSALPAGMTGIAAEEWPLATMNRVYPGYFRTMSIDLLEGRDFSGLDGVGSAPAIVVNRTMADRYWSEANAVGQTVLMGDAEDPGTFTVVGVVEDVQHADLDPASVGAQIYQPALQAGARRFFLVARTRGDPADAVPALRDAMARTAPDLPVRLRPMSDVVAESQLQWSLSSLFLAIFGGGALLLATLGIYGLISYSVAQRERELAVRMALGASGSEIRRRVVGDGLELTGLGLAIGLAAALAMGRLLSTVLYGVSAADPATLGSVLGLFLVVAALASLVPATRASRTSPVTALRSG